MIDKAKIKNIGFIVLVISIYEILRYSIPYYFPFEKLNNEHKLSVFQLLFTIIAGSWALRIYYLTNKREKENYLKIYVSTIFDENHLSIKTELKNLTDTDRKIHSSFLIITKQGSEIIDEVNCNLNQNFKNTNCFSNLQSVKNLLKQDFAFIQLPFYTNENVKVGNEDLSFSIASIFEKQNISISQIYEVRFFVFRNLNDTNAYHRCVQTVFISDVPLNILFKDFHHNNYSKNKKSKQNFNTKTQ